MESGKALGSIWYRENCVRVVNINENIFNLFNKIISQKVLTNEYQFQFKYIPSHWTVERKRKDVVNLIEAVQIILFARFKYGQQKF